MKLILEDAGVPYAVRCEELGPTIAFDMWRGSEAAIAVDSTPFPVMFPPAIWHRPHDGEEVFVNTHIASVRYLGQCLGYAPGSAAEGARADQIAQNAVDYWWEGRCCFHPLDSSHLGSYSSQKDAADKSSQQWKIVMRFGPRKPCAGGASVTFADFLLFHVLDATEAQFNDEHFSRAWDAAPDGLKAYKAYFQSDRRKPWAKVLVEVFTVPVVFACWRVCTTRPGISAKGVQCVCRSIPLVDQRPLRSEAALGTRCCETVGNPKRSGGSAFVLNVLLLVAVVILGCANIIAKQIAAQPLKSYSYVLTLAVQIAYLPLYWSILGLLLLVGAVPPEQFRFVWQRHGSGAPGLAFFAASALGDALGDGIHAICTDHVSGPLMSLSNSFISIFIAILSLCVFQERYSLMQCLALLAVLSAVVVGFLPSLEGQTTNTQPAFAIIAAGSCFFYAVSFVIKELMFKRFKAWQEVSHPGEAASSEAGSGRSGLNIFVMNAHLAVFQLPLTVLLLPLNELLKQTHGEGIVAFSREAFACVFGGSCGPDSNHGELAGRCVAIFVVLNVLWNLSILLAVKQSGALATNVALKAVFPVSTVLFAYVDWPLLGPTSLSWLVWLSILILLPSIAAYQWATDLQAQRARRARATCCWPLFAHLAPPPLLEPALSR
ncbi:crtp2 [Symbiodinium natans]|uniref:Crtp2 protein n=1 Tax=Symbiodinium natans TaxID=878477 RepID=A0A812QZ75_9DINO|nr:crtp2 [Symbiodinium natans]